jgi:Asp-tRNA(Asn)/Glu-tRNA(Gln) amidotransferase A subunit family amidase
MHGIAFALKNIYCTAEIHTLTRANCGPDFDATPVTKLQQAGAILLGKLVTHEFAYGRRHSTFPSRLPETHGTVSTSVVQRWWLDPGSSRLCTAGSV